MADDTSEQSRTPADDRKLVDGIIYLSSLVSESKAIDPMLDSLRNVTADWDSKIPLEHSKRLALQKLTIDLKQYLIHRDPLRSFTSDMLDSRLATNLTGTTKKIPPFTIFVGGALIIAAIVLALPLPLQIVNRLYLAVTVLLLTLIVITIRLYLSSLHNFNQALRGVFSYLCIGSSLLGVTCLHYTLIGLLQLTNQPLFAYGGATEIALAAIIAIYIGLSHYAKILKVSTKSIFISLTISFVITIILAVVTAYAREIPDKFFFSLAFASTLGTSVFAFFGGRIALALLKNVTASYAKSLRVVYIFLLACAATALTFVIALTWLKHLSVGALGLLIAVAGVPSIGILMYSGYSFKKETGR